VLRSVTGAYCLVAVALWYWSPGSGLVAKLVSGHPWYVTSLVFHYYGDAILLLFVIGAALIGRPELREVLGRAPSSRDITPVALTVAITFCASGALTTLALVPLSFVLPGFVTWYLQWSYPVTTYLAADGSIPVGANVLRFVSLMVLTPILEEMLFRGYLLRAWSEKWGLWTGVLLSSAVFGAIHADTLAAMLTGVGFALLYLRTQSLWAPILAHSAYNLVASAWNLWEMAESGWDYYVQTIDELRDASWIGVLELLVAVLLVDRIVRRGALGPFRLPSRPAIR
jgi:membrane protease YdiL (CAAX protease family)